MTLDDYLQVLSKKLNGFPPADRALLLEEIGSHIESGEEDPKLGIDRGQRRERLMSELGSPGQMAKGFRTVYQPGGLIDYLLIVIPYLLNQPINLLLVSLMTRHPWADARLVVLFHLCLLAVGFARRSPLLTLFWLADLAVQLMGVLWYSGVYYGPLQTTCGCILLVGLIFLLGRTTWQHRQDPLVVSFGLQPFFMGTLSIGLAIVHLHATSPFLPFELILLQLNEHFAGFLYFGVVVALAPFFLVKNRDIRWGAWGIYWVFAGFYRNWLDYQITYPGYVYYVWALFPLLVVIMGWIFDGGRRRVSMVSP